jgi:hypothetical protein
MSARGGDNALFSASLVPSVKPSYMRYSWDQLPYDTSLADALQEHPLPPHKDRPLLDILNESAEKNIGSTATWKPGTLDVLALGQESLETAYDPDLGDILKNTVRALPKMKHQEQAQEFTSKFIPLLFNWVQSTTRSGLSDPDFRKEQSLFDFVSEINELQSDNAQDAIGIQHAFYQALSPSVYEAFDRALPACHVTSIAEELKEIGDKLLSAEQLISDSSRRTAITTMRKGAERCYSAARDRSDALIEEEEARNQEPIATQESTSRIVNVVEENGISTPLRILSPLPTERFSVSPTLSRETDDRGVSHPPSSPDSVPNARNGTPTYVPLPASVNAPLSEATRDTATPNAVTPEEHAVGPPASPDTSSSLPVAQSANQKSWVDMNKQERRTWTNNNLDWRTRGQRAAALAKNTIRNWIAPQRRRNESKREWP